MKTVPPVRSDATLVQICGAGHSGSTLLGMMLGSHSRGFYLGEAKKARNIGNLNKPLKKRSCKFCGEDCPIWGGFRWESGTRMLRELREKTGASVLVDSTKDVQWCAQRAADARALNMRTALLFLQRDGRAVMNSRVRKYPDRDFDTQLDDWLARITETQALFAAHAGPKMIVRYEELATAPEATLRAISHTIGINFEASMLDYGARAHHPLGGNNGTQFLAAGAHGTDTLVAPGERSAAYYQRHDGSVRLDARWRHELSAELVARFEERAGSLNEPMRWDLDVQS